MPAAETVRVHEHAFDDRVRDLTVGTATVPLHQVECRHSGCAPTDFGEPVSDVGSPLEVEQLLCPNHRRIVGVLDVAEPLELVVALADRLGVVEVFAEGLHRQLTSRSAQRRHVTEQLIYRP